MKNPNRFKFATGSGQFKFTLTTPPPNPAAPEFALINQSPVGLDLLPVFDCFRRHLHKWCQRY